MSVRYRANRFLTYDPGVALRRSPMIRSISRAALPFRLTAVFSAVFFLSTTVVCSAGGLNFVRAASAQERPSVAVVGVHGTGSESEKLLRSITGDIAKGFLDAASFDVFDADALSGRFLPARAQLMDAVFLGPADDALQEGRVQYESARFEQAIAAFRRAESAAANSLEFVRDQRLLVDIQLYLGLSYASMGSREEAQEAFGEVVRLAPDRVLDSLEYPPKIVSLFDEARSSILEREGSAIKIDAPEGTRIRVDGRRVGEGSVLVSDLRPGFHVLLAEREGSGRHFSELNLAEGETREVTVALKKLGLSRGGKTRFETERSSLTRRLYEEIARVSGTDLVVIAAFDSSGNLQLALYSARSDTMSESVEASLQAAPTSQSAYVKQLVKRLALSADESGAIKGDQVSAKVPKLMLGENPILGELIFGAPPDQVVPVADATAVAPVDEEPARVRRERKPVKPGAVVGVILGILGAGGAATGVYFAVRPQPEPIGTLRITIP